MSEKCFKVRVYDGLANNSTCDSIKDSLTSFNVRVSDGSKVEVYELPSIPEVPIVETGVVQMPKNYHLVHYENDSPSGDELNGSRVNLTKYPMFRDLCDPKSIHTSFDFSVIPVGSLIVVDYFTHCEAGFFRFNSENKPQISPFNNGYQNCRYIGGNIKSIRIIERSAK